MTPAYLWWPVSVLLLPFVFLDVLSFWRMARLCLRGRGRSPFLFIGLLGYWLILFPLRTYAEFAHDDALRGQAALVLRWLVAFHVIGHGVGLAFIWFFLSPFREREVTEEGGGDVH